MSLHRREFFVISGGLFAGAASARIGSAAPAPARFAANKTAPADSIAAFRASVDLDPDYIHMAGLLLASHPAPLRDAIDGFRRELDRNPVKAVHEMDTPRCDAARLAAADFVGGKP